MKDLNPAYERWAIIFGQDCITLNGLDLREFNDDLWGAIEETTQNTRHLSDSAEVVWQEITYGFSCADSGDDEDQGYDMYVPSLDDVLNVAELVDAIPNEVKNPHAILLSVYDHGGRVYSLLGQGMNCQWDTAHGGAILVPSNECVEAAKGVAESDGRELMDVLRGWAVDVLDDYNAYLSGEVYGLVDVVYTYNAQDGQGEPHLDDRNEIDYDDHGSCWGFIGEKYAKGELGDFVGIY